MIGQDFAGRVLSFDSATARAHAAFVAARRSAGQPIPEADCQIVAIARAKAAAVATRSTGDFEHCGIVVLDPWSGDRPAP